VAKSKVDADDGQGKFDIVERTFVFGERVARLCAFLKAGKKASANRINQLERAADAVGALVEEAQGAESKKDFIHKMSVAQKEARESHYWLRKIMRSGAIAPTRIAGLTDEARQLKLILAAIINSARDNDRPGPGSEEE
jgi:four helix bundle protein